MPTDRYARKVLTHYLLKQNRNPEKNLGDGHT